MRVLQVDSGREWRGGQNQVRLLCRELGAMANVTQVLATQAGSDLARRAEAVDVRGVPWTLGVDPRAAWRLWLIISDLRPDVVHAHDSHGLSVARLALWGRDGAPRLVATRRVDFHLKNAAPWRRADRVIAISDAVQQVLVADGISPHAVVVIPSGIDPEEVRAAARAPLDIRGRLGLAAGTRLAVNVAALVPHKDQRTLVRAAGLARPLAPDLHWAIAGAGELAGSLADEVTRAGLGDRVHLLGYIPEADALIREADVLVMSSKEEGLGTVVLHALALGKPVVATRAGGLPEMLPPTALVDVGDAAALARSVVATVTAGQAPLPLPEQFTARAMARRVLAVYHDLV